MVYDVFFYCYDFVTVELGFPFLIFAFFVSILIQLLFSSKQEAYKRTPKMRTTYRKIVCKNNYWRTQNKK